MKPSERIRQRALWLASQYPEKYRDRSSFFFEAIMEYLDELHAKQEESR